ncbi:MAG: 50S ribosomal protein L10 [Candidatus Micrarchaeota archaeon]
MAKSRGETMTSHTKPWKEAEFVSLQKLAKEYPVIALANIEGFPADLFQRLRKKLSGKAIIKVSKRLVIQRALKESGIKSKEFPEYARRMTAVIFTKLSPFELAHFLKKNKGSTGAKAGQIAPEDITVPAGDTGLPPGPALTDLKNAGLKVKMMGPTIHVDADTIVAKAGQLITPAVANVLSKLNIKPIKVGLNLTAVLEGDTVYLPAVLDIDEEQMLANLQTAYMSALGLALEIGYMTPATVEIMVGRAFKASKAVALKGKIVNQYTKDELSEGESKAAKEEAKSEAKEAVPEEKRSKLND